MDILPCLVLHMNLLNFAWFWICYNKHKNYHEHENYCYKHLRGITNYNAKKIKHTQTIHKKHEQEHKVCKQVSKCFTIPKLSDKLYHHVTLVWPVPLAQVWTLPQLILPSKTWFFGIYLNFQRQKSLKSQYLPHSECKSYQINSIKSCSSRSFQQHQRHIPIPPKFSAMI